MRVHTSMTSKFMRLTAAYPRLTCTVSSRCDDPSGKYIATHDGQFHCDEALAVGMLKMLPEFEKHDVVRTRVQRILGLADIVVDVGAVYDVASKRFDHHQREFTTQFSFSAGSKRTPVTKLSSAGLVYLHYGRAVIATQLKVDGQPAELLTDALYDKLYTSFIEHIDGIDNGVESHEGKKLYSIPTTLSARVSYLNPSWNEEGEVDEQERFRAASDLATSEFVDALRRLIQVWLPARSLVEAAVAKRFEVDASGRILKFDRACPWKEHLFDLEDESNGQMTNLAIVLYPDSNGTWRIQSVPERHNEFQSRMPLPEKLRGLRDDVLAEASGVKDAVFAHAAGFIGGAKSYNGVLTLARLSLEAAGSKA